MCGLLVCSLPAPAVPRAVSGTTPFQSLAPKSAGVSPRACRYPSQRAFTTEEVAVGMFSGAPHPGSAYQVHSEITPKSVEIQSKVVPSAIADITRLAGSFRSLAWQAADDPFLWQKWTKTNHESESKSEESYMDESLLIQSSS